VNKQEHKIRSWLDAPDPHADHMEIKQKKTPGTGAWLMSNEQYVAWKNGDEMKPIWINGRGKQLTCMSVCILIFNSAGCGKSVLMCSVFMEWDACLIIYRSTIIEDLCFQQVVDPTISVIYFYFNFSQPPKCTGYGLLSSLVDQLAFSQLSAWEILNRRYSQRHTSKQQLSVADLLELLQSIFLLFKKIYIVVDALDECEEWNKLEKALTTILGWKYNNIHLLLASREESHISQLLQSVSTVIKVEHQKSDTDIALYVDTELHVNPAFSGCSSTIKAEIREKLKSKAYGMFVFCSHIALENNNAQVSVGLLSDGKLITLHQAQGCSKGTG
jgi:hypothetical protein